ncbi:metal-sensitive transcriptional regulator [Calidithermus roseus]|uniref:Copper-sensing transcriptional repressor CsoR n=1 Tax=Calidithermus roseus TaxID=1644118 RepID=A0A399EW12_9DEIN|nr:metal-sensitive transcriptional regulator [Calidithermus roseus]RIH87279.1 Copper-sensing transcriptional repressor CsoR [Calidithermus roseus]
MSEALIPSPPEAERQKLLHRLRRLEGQVRGLQRMIEEGRPCHEVLTLLAGVRGALEGIGEIVLEEYLLECQAEMSRGEIDTKAILDAVRLLR